MLVGLSQHTIGGALTVNADCVSEQVFHGGVDIATT
jgi:hypothetical protein